MTKKKIKETEDKVLEKLLGGEDALAQYHKLVEDLWDQAFKGKININTLRAKQEFEDKVLEAISNPTHDTTTEIKPDQIGDFSPIEIKSTVTEDGIKIDTKVLEEEASSLDDWEQLDAWEQEEDDSKLEAWAHVPSYAEDHPDSDKFKEKACEDMSKRFDKKVNKIFEDGKKRLEENRKLKVSGTEEKLKPTYEEFKADWERRKAVTEELEKKAAGEEVKDYSKEWEEYYKRDKAKNIYKPSFPEYTDISALNREEIERKAAEEEREKWEEIRKGAMERTAEVEAFVKEAMRSKAAARSEWTEEQEKQSIEKPKFKDWRNASVPGSEEHTALMKEGKRLTRLVYRDKQKLNESKMLKYIITAVSVHCLAFCFWVGTLFFDIGQAREVIIYLLMAVYTLFYVLLSVKAYESIKIQRKLEEVDRKYEGY